MTTSEEFRKFGKEMIDYVADYMDNVGTRRVIPKIEPGYIQPLLPDEAPETPDQWKDVLSDTEKIIMPGVTHWNHPHFHAYFPCSSSGPSIVADILSDGIGGVGFSWMASPAITELEMVMMDWLGKLLKLPEHFIFSSGGSGGGVIQNSASDTTFIALLTARSRHVGTKLEYIDNITKLVAYSSTQAHSSVERAALLGGVKIRMLEPDEKFSLRGETLRKAIEEDKANGLIPFYVVATLGTTASCAFDDIKEIGPVCNEHNIWLHIDAAYAGSAFVCEEYRYLLDGVELVDSFNFNLGKWMFVNMDCSAMWVKNADEHANAYNVDAVYLRHKHQGKLPDYRHWQVSLGRRFRSLKVWFVLRLYGKSGIQKHIRNHIELAHKFEELIEADETFELTAPVIMGLVCFRVKGSNALNERLNNDINEEGVIHITPSKLRETFILRFALCSNSATLDDVNYAFKNIKKHALRLLAN